MFCAKATGRPDWLRRLAAVAFALLLYSGGAAQADITLIRLANEGVIVDDGSTRVMIDGLVVEPYAVYGGLGEQVAAALEEAKGDFAGIALALATHRHHEHNQPRFACRFLQASPSTVFAATGQVIDLMRERCRSFVTTSPRVRRIEPQYGQPVMIEQAGARVTAFRISHGKRKYARIAQAGFLVEMGGVNVLHVGDAVMDPAEYERVGLDWSSIDVALIPARYFQPGPGGEIVQRYLNAPHKLAVHIPPGEMREVKEYLQASYPDVVVLEKPLDRIRITPDPR